MSTYSTYAYDAIDPMSSKRCKESGRADILKPKVGRNVYANFRLRVLTAIQQAKCFDVLWTQAKDWKPAGTGQVKRKLRSKDSVGGKITGTDKEDITAEEATITARTIILDHLFDGPWQKKLLQICERGDPIFSFFWELDNRYYNASDPKEKAEAARKFQDFKYNPNQDCLTIAGQVHDHLRDEHAFHSGLELDNLAKWTAYQTFLDLGAMPNVHLKETVDHLNERLRFQLKGELSDASLEEFRDTLEDKVDDLRLTGDFAALDPIPDWHARPGVAMSAHKVSARDIYESTRAKATYSRRVPVDYNAIPGQGRVPRRGHDQGQSDFPTARRVSWQDGVRPERKRDSRQSSRSSSSSSPDESPKPLSMPSPKPDHVKWEDWRNMSGDDKDICVGPNNKDPCCRKIIENADGTRRRCGEKHFTRKHSDVHPTAQLAALEDQDALDYEFYLQMKSSQDTTAHPPPLVAGG